MCLQPSGLRDDWGQGINGQKVQDTTLVEVIVVVVVCSSSSSSIVCAQLHGRQEAEMAEAKAQMDKEYETLKSNVETQTRAMEQRHERDREALRRTGAGEEAKVQRSLQPKHDAEMRQQQAHLKKEYARIKDTFKKVMCGFLCSCILTF